MRISLAVLLAVGGIASASAEVAEPRLRSELLEMRQRDHAVRTKRDVKGVIETDKANTRRLKEIIDEYGWPTRSLVGNDGASAAWLIAQHADLDREFQLRVLALMAPLVAKGEVKASDVAYLHDRTHRPQRYGTQGACSGPGTWTPHAIEDPENVDQRRAEVGMRPPTLGEYVAFMNRLCK